MTYLTYIFRFLRSELYKIAMSAGFMVHVMIPHDSTLHRHRPSKFAPVEYMKTCTMSTVTRCPCIDFFLFFCDQTGAEMKQLKNIASRSCKKSIWMQIFDQNISSIIVGKFSRSRIAWPGTMQQKRQQITQHTPLQ